MPTLFSIDECEKVIYMNTFSKSLSPTIRISYMVLPVHLVYLLFRSLYFYSCSVSNFEQYTLAEFIRQGYFEKHINRMRLYYMKKRALVMDVVMQSKLVPYCEIWENDSGLHFLLKLKTTISDQEIEHKLMERGIRINTLSDYNLLNEENKSHYFIINYSNLDMEKIKYALDVIEEILTEKYTS